MTDMSKVDSTWMADAAAGTLECWFDGPTDADPVISGQVRVKWVESMVPHRSRVGLYIGTVEVESCFRSDEVNDPTVKRFRVAVKVVDDQ